MIFSSAIVSDKLMRNDTYCVLHYQQKNKTNGPRRFAPHQLSCGKKAPSAFDMDGSR